MAGSSPVDNLLDKLTHRIEDLTVGPSDQMALKMLNTFDKKKVWGIGLEANRSFRTGLAGKISQADAGGALAVGQAPTAIVGKYAVKKMTLGFEWNDEDLRKMEGGRAGLHTTLAEEMKGGMKKFKLNQERLLFGDGSGVVARVSGVHSTVTEIACGPGPILAIEDDEIRGYTNRGGGSAGTQTATRRIVAVDHQGSKIHLDAAAVGFADDEVVMLYNGHDTGATKFTEWAMGLKGHLNHEGDDTDSSANVWDTDDASGFRAVKTYNNLDRTTGANRKMLCGHLAASGAAVSPYYISYGASHLRTKGVVPSRILLLMSIKQYNRIVEMYSGGMLVAQDQTIKLPGGTLRLPVITAGGQSQVPILASPYMLDGAIATLALGDFEQIYTKGGWVKGAGGSNLLLRPTASAATYDHVWQAVMVTYWNTTCLKPYEQFLVSGLDTTDA